MFDLRYLKEKNRIYLKLLGELSETEFNTYKNAIMTLIDGSQPGFTVLADLTECDKTVLDASDSFNVIREHGAKRGFKKNALVLNQEFYNIYSERLSQGSKNFFLTVKEADCYLDAI